MNLTQVICVYINITWKRRNKRIQGSARNQLLSSFTQDTHSHCFFLGVNLLPFMTGHSSPYSVVKVLKRKEKINCFREFLCLCWAENFTDNHLTREPLTSLYAGHFKTCSPSWIKQWATLNKERASASSKKGSRKASPWPRHGASSHCPLHVHHNDHTIKFLWRQVEN